VEFHLSPKVKSANFFRQSLDFKKYSKEKVVNEQVNGKPRSWWGRRRQEE
jgi:hypothetical protein